MLLVSSFSSSSEINRCSNCIKPLQLDYSRIPMGKTELTKRSIDADNRRRHPPKLFHPVLREFFMQIPHKIQDGIKVSFIPMRLLLFSLNWILCESHVTSFTSTVTSYEIQKR